LGTERHEARRIDDQLRGRCGRQGDPGESQFFVSLEDDLMRIFGAERIQSLMERFNLPEDTPIDVRYVSGIIESAQKKVEGHHFDARKHVLQYDEVLFKHREKFYALRTEILKRAEVSDRQSEDSLRSYILEIIKKQGKSEEDYLKKEEELEEDEIKSIERFVILRTIDFLWKDHLTMMEELREAVRLRAYGQKDPLTEYKREGHKAFHDLMENMELEIAERILKVRKVKKNPSTPKITIKRKDVGSKEEGVSVRTSSAGRNDPCPCGSGKKYKKCHGK